MTKYEWKDFHSVGVAQIDDEHHQILQAIQRLETVLLGDGSDEVTRIAFDDLIRSTADHFESEERLLAEHGYPRLAAQKLEHEVFRMNLSSLASLQLIHENADLLNVLDSIFGWWEHHILTEDMKFQEFFAAAGVE